MLAVVTGQTATSATSAGQIGVQISLTGAQAAAVSCTSKSGAANDSTPVQVTCTSNVFVNIAQVSLSRESLPSVAGQFITGFGLARSIKFSECIVGQINDAAAQVGRGWNFEGWIYACNNTPERARQLARWELRNAEGTLTALRVVGDNDHPGAFEMLVSF